MDSDSSSHHSCKETAPGFYMDDDGNWAPHMFFSKEERAESECSDLLRAKHYEEAYGKLEEYLDAKGGWVHKGDWKMMLKAEVGYLQVHPENKDFEAAKYAWRQAQWYDMGTFEKELLESVNEMVDIFAKKHKIPLKYDDYSNPDLSEADVEATAKLLDFMLYFLEVGNNWECYGFRGNGFLHIFVMGIRNFREKGDIENAHKFFEAVKKLPCYKTYIVDDDNPFEEEE